MPGALPEKFDRLTFKPRDFRPMKTDIRSKSEEASAIQHLALQIALLAQSVEQMTRQTIRSVQDCQTAINAIIDHLTP